MWLCGCMCAYVYTNAHWWEDIGKQCMCRRAGTHMYAWMCTHLHANMKRCRGNVIVAKTFFWGQFKEVQSVVCSPSLLTAFTVVLSTNPLFPLCSWVSLPLFSCLSLSLRLSTDLAVHLQYFEPISQAFHTSLMSSRGMWLEYGDKHPPLPPPAKKKSTSSC